MGLRSSKEDAHDGLPASTATGSPVYAAACEQALLASLQGQGPLAMGLGAQPPVVQTLAGPVLTHTGSHHARTELPVWAVELGRSLPEHVRRTPVRLLLIDAMLSWRYLKAFEDVPDSECRSLPYQFTDSALWQQVVAVSWRWAAQPPQPEPPGPMLRQASQPMPSPVQAHAPRDTFHRQLASASLRSSGVASGGSGAGTFSTGGAGGSTAAWPSFCPMSVRQFQELQALLRGLQTSLGLQYVWIDWACSPQYDGGGAARAMSEVLRSKLYFARAAKLLVLPNYRAMPGRGLGQLVIASGSRELERRAAALEAAEAEGCSNDSATSSSVSAGGNHCSTSAVHSGERSRVAAAYVGALLAKQQMACHDYWGRVWTLAERMARAWRNERLCDWLTLEAWLGMVADALCTTCALPLASPARANGSSGSGSPTPQWHYCRQEQDPALEAFRRVAGGQLMRLMGQVLRSLEQAVRTCEPRAHVRVVQQLEGRVADLFEAAVGAWHAPPATRDEPSGAWLRTWLVADGISRTYCATVEADRVWAVYSFFCCSREADRMGDASAEPLANELMLATGSSSDGEAGVGGKGSTAHRHRCRHCNARMPLFGLAGMGVVDALHVLAVASVQGHGRGGRGRGHRGSTAKGFEGAKGSTQCVCAAAAMPMAELLGITLQGLLFGDGSGTTSSPLSPAASGGESVLADAVALQGQQQVPGLPAQQQGQHQGLGLAPLDGIAHVSVTDDGSSQQHQLPGCQAGKGL